MPIYEYECIPNKHRFEVIQKFSDPPVVHCTVCGEPVQKLLSAPAIQFKGSGWYITDYARKGSTDKEGANKENKDTSPAKDSSGESKPATTDSTEKAAKPSTETPKSSTDKKD